jgi:predicted DNA-binding transcriptional regulator YafY
MTTTATRLITLILLLQRQPNQKAADLAEKLGVSIRTLHRYFEMLDEMGIPIYAERGPYGGFSLVRGYKLPPLVFTPEEAVAVSLGTSLVREMWGQLYQEAAQGALAKLENVLPDDQRHEVAWARRSLVATGMHRSDLEALAPFLEKLRRAVRETRRVSMSYRSGSHAEPEQRDLDPYALIHRAGWWYVVGYCHLRKDLRSFRVDRIEAVNLTDQLFPAPVDFDVRAYMAQEWQGTPQIRVRFRFDPHFTHLALYNRAYWESLVENPDGSVEVTLTTPDANWAASYALAYGPAMTVLEPPEVRQLVQEWAQATANLYRPAGLS